MSEPLNILLVEDSEDDALLLLREIRRGGYDPLYERVETPEEFRAALSKSGWDIVVSDYSLPRFGGMDALRLLKESGSDIPFIIVSGVMGEGTLVDAMKAGADDYVLKDNMARLTPAIRRELCEANVRRERRLAEAAFMESEERYRRLVENANDIVATADLDGKIISMNSAIKRIAGYEPEDVMGKVFFSFLTPQSQERAREMLRAKIENRAQGTTYEIQIIAKDGGVVDAEVSSNLMIKGGRPVGVEAIMRDITARKKAEERLSLLATAIESTYESVIITDAAGVIQYVNPSFERASGYGMEEAVGKRPGDIIRSGRHSEFFYRDMWSTISGGGVWKGRIVNRKKKGEFYEEDSTISPVFDSSGAIINYVAVSKDVTQEVLLEKQFLQAQKMEALGTLAGGIAHDFNNILFAILGYTDLAIKEMENGSEAREYLVKVGKAGRRAKDLVQQILLFGRKSESELAPVQLHLLISEALKLLHISLPPNIEIRSDVEKSSDIAMANPTQVHQVIINLCANAIHAMEDKGGVLEVELHPVDVDEEFARAHPDLRPGPYVRLSVKDMGHGIPPEIIDKIFDPFFTTKEVGKGTGLGLAAVHGIVERHKAAITVESEAGKGSTFSVYFPRAQKAGSPDEAIKAAPSGGGERVLIVDDEESVALLLEKTLETAGYKADSMTNCVEAMERFLGAPDEYDLVITDMVMPKMTGDTLARAILKVRPDTPIIMISGYGKSAGMENVSGIGAREILKKPVETDVLLTTVRRVLDKHERKTTHGENTSG